MKELRIEGTKKIPDVNFDAGSGRLVIKGRSITENAYKFYMPLIEWVSNYFGEPAEETVLDIVFEYINSSSIIWVMKILKRMETYHMNGENVKINWFYKDEDICDAGEDIKAILQVPVNLIELN